MLLVGSLKKIAISGREAINVNVGVVYRPVQTQQR